MKIAVIDCGTNTFNLLIRNQESGQLIHNSKISVRLGEGGNHETHIGEAAFQRGLQALESHLATARSEGAEAIYAVATAAIRSAENGPEFVQSAAETGVRINVIDGLQEASLIYEGVKRGIKFQDAPTLIMDIGGGSTEFILRRKGVVDYKASFPIGSSRLLEKFRPADPILSEQIEEVTDYLEEELSELIEACKSEWPRVLIGSSGSFDTLAAMCAENFKTSRFEEDETSYTFDMFEYMQIARQMLQSNFEERLATPGMIPMRADMIVMACIQINFVITRLGIKMLQQCNYALKEGFFFTLNENPEAWQKS